MFRSGEVEGSFYVRLRGTNLPQGTPFETDVDGNPLADNLADNIPCPFELAEGEDTTRAPNGEEERRVPEVAACPDHLPVNEKLGVKVVDADVEAWADLWFYANPIFIDVQ